MIFFIKKRIVEIIPLDLFKFGHEFVFPFISLNSIYFISLIVKILYSSANL